MKLATWNVMLPVAERRRQEMRSHIDREQPDILVLTETHDGFDPGLDYACSSAQGRDGLHGPEHRWVTIWSRRPLEPLVTSDPQRAAACLITPEYGESVVVYGAVLPWIGSMWRGHTGAGGVAFREALAVQGADWIRLRDEHPGSELFVMGDFNQDMVKPRYYGTNANRAALETALAAARLVSATAGDCDPIRRDSAPCACIDHICINQDSAWRTETAVRWPDAPIPQRRLSDHFGVAVSLVRN